MLITQATSNDLTRKIAIQIPICHTFTIDTNVLIDFNRGKKRMIEQFIASGMHIYSYDSNEVLLQEKPIDSDIFSQTLNGWISYIKDQFYKISEIQSIYYSINDKDVDIWILIPKRDIVLLRRLVDLEIKVLETFTYGGESLFRLEFHIVYCNHTDEKMLVPSKALYLQK